MIGSTSTKFEPIKYLFTSYFEMELHLTTVHFDRLDKEDSLENLDEPKIEDFIIRNLNLREIINLQMGERAQRVGLRIDNRLYLQDIQDLANFILYKIKTSNIFNITLSLKQDEEAVSSSSIS
jgi:hypothetical protein